MVKLVHGYRRYRGSWPLCVSHFLSIPRNSVVLFIAHLLEIMVLNRAFTHKHIFESAYAFYMMDQNFGCSHDYILWGHLCLPLEKLALGCSQVLVQEVYAQSVPGIPFDPILSFCCFLGTVVLVCIMRSHRNLSHMTQTHYGVAYVF